MAEGTPNNGPEPFDVPTIQALIRMMSRHNINEVDLRQGDKRIRLLRGLPTTMTSVAAVPQTLLAAPVSHHPGPTGDGAAKPTPAAPAASGKVLYEIKSPTPGTYYAAPSPDAETYVRVGSRVKPESVVCQVEAMKLFTEIQAEVGGVIAEILVQNQQAVEYGTVLFRVDTSG